MLKLASIALIPVLAATFFPHDEDPKSAPPVPRTNWVQAQVKQDDRAFLGTLRKEDQEEALVQQIAAQKAEQERLINLQEEALIPVRRAIAVERPPADELLAEAVREGHEVRRAMPVDQPTVVVPTAGNSPVSPSSSADLRGTLRQSFVAMAGPEPEVRRAIPVGRPKFSFSLYGE